MLKCLLSGPRKSSRAHIAELLVKEQEREEKAQQVVQAVQVLKGEMKEKERIAQKEHKKVKVRYLLHSSPLLYV